MSTIAENITALRRSLPPDVTLVAVSKYHPDPDLMEAYNAGQRVFGENLVQEMRQKQADLPDDIQWHFIGHLQTNKVKYIAPYVALIHSVDSLRLLREIDRQAAKNDRIIDVLLQIHVAAEETKFGFTPHECLDMLAGGEWRQCDHVRICGLMGMATNTDDEQRIRQDFTTLRNLFQELKEGVFAESSAFAIRSYGMSHDYPLAIEEGANMVRVGTRIFGERVYNT